METRAEKENKLILIPKVEKYTEYMLQVCMQLPRIEKFSIGTEYKASMYQLIQNVMLLRKIERQQGLNVLNKIDALINTQRIYLRIMKKQRWIDEKKFNVASAQIYEIAKILGGLFKYYAKNDKKPI